ncbi:MAG: sugar kinase [Candidatus Eisenbacteria sp.]|nr:sugar kinase [Candidatus Eisenbacteria bacterium]
MKIVVVGSVALDTVHTPDTCHSDLLGGSASYFSLSAVQFAPVGIVAVVGSDFSEVHLELLRGRGVDLAGLERRAGKTFRWEGEYGADPNQRRTIRTELGVFESFHPELPHGYIDSEALFLANIDPVLQLEVLDRAGKVPLVAVDTMNFWIDGHPDAVREVIKRAHVLVVNDEESRLLTGIDNPIQAAPQIREMGPEIVIIKKGAHGAATLGPWGWLLFPAFPVADVKDPTGAGDSFAGGLVGYLAGKDWRDRDRFAEGLAVGTAVSSLVVQDYGVSAIREERLADLEKRCQALRESTRFACPQGM